jgi:cytochrome P450
MFCYSILPFLQKEVDNVTMNNSWSTLNELRSKMPYTEAVLLEVQRIGNIVPGALLHSNTKTIHIENYTLPPGTSVNFQMSGALKDPIVFPSSDEFIPERFIDAKGLFVPHPNVVPFGVGKRKCLGESLAKMELFIFFAGIINKFEIKLANENEIPSTAYRPGITLSPYPFKLRFIARK